MSGCLGQRGDGRVLCGHSTSCLAHTAVVQVGPVPAAPLVTQHSWPRSLICPSSSQRHLLLLLPPSIPQGKPGSILLKLICHGAGVSRDVSFFSVQWLSAGSENKNK